MTAKTNMTAPCNHLSQTSAVRIRYAVYTDAIQWKTTVKYFNQNSPVSWTCGCAGKTEIPWEHVPYLSAFAVMIHYEEALYIKCMQLHLYLLPSGEGKAFRGYSTPCRNPRGWVRRAEGFWDSSAYSHTAWPTAIKFGRLIIGGRFWGRPCTKT